MCVFHEANDGPEGRERAVVAQDHIEHEERECVVVK